MIAHRKALDVLNTVGLSNSVLRLIERRHRVDNWIKYAGRHDFDTCYFVHHLEVDTLIFSKAWWFEVVLRGGPEGPGKIYCPSPCASELEGTTTVNLRADTI
nr:membrin-11 [Quercus suber]